MKKLRLWAFTLLLLSPLLLPMRVSTAQLDMDDSAISGDLFDRISPPITDFFISAQQVSAGPPTKKSPRDFIGRIYAPKPEDWKVRSEAHPIIGVPNTPLPLPFAVAVRNLDDGFPLSGLPITFAVTAGGGTFSVPRALTDHTSIAETTLTLGPNIGTNTVSVSAAGIEVPATFHAISDTEAPPIIADVNNDGVVNVLDLILIASNFGQSRQNDADVNRDGVVSILDLVLAAGMFEEEAAAPSAQSQVPEIPTAVEVQGWLTDARALQVRYPLMKRGVLVLEQLLVFLTPRETELLANFPNPFNPETWIPYRLAEDAFVTLTIYDLSGQVVCTLDVGHRIASAYESRSRAIYWAGKNGLGKPVASGVYFYTLTAGGFSATRRMLILK